MKTCVLILFFFFSFHSAVTAQLFTKADVDTVIRMNAVLQLEIKNLSKDTQTAFRQYNANLSALLTKTNNLDNLKARSASIVLPSEHSKEKNKTDSIKRLITGLQKDSADLSGIRDGLNLNRNPSSEREISLAGKKLAALKEQNKEIRKSIFEDSILIIRASERQKNKDRTVKENKKLEERLIDIYNDSVDAITKYPHYSAALVMSLNKLRENLFLAGVDTNGTAIKRTDGYLNYCSLLKSAENAISVSYDKLKVHQFTGQLIALTNNKGLGYTKEQQNKVGEAINLLNNFCTLTDKVYKLIIDKGNSAAAKSSFHLNAENAIASFIVREANIQKYPFLYNELQRMKAKASRQEGFGDCKVKPCEN